MKEITIEVLAGAFADLLRCHVGPDDEFFCSADEAEDLAQKLLWGAQQMRARNVRPATRPLPLSEAFCLETPGASRAQTRRSGTPGGDNFQGCAS